MAHGSREKEKTSRVYNREAEMVRFSEPAVGIEPTTARLRIECSTTELRWQSSDLKSQTRRVCSSILSGGENALARTRTVTPCGTTPSRWRVYQFHHQGISYIEQRVPRSRERVLGINGADGARTRDLSSDSRVL